MLFANFMKSALSCGQELGLEPFNSDMQTNSLQDVWVTGLLRIWALLASAMSAV